jgi:putative DNA primase/helicase
VSATVTPKSPEEEGFEPDEIDEAAVVRSEKVQGAAKAIALAAATGRALAVVPAVAEPAEAWGFCNDGKMTLGIELHPTVPFVNAQKLVGARAWHHRDGMRTLHFSQGVFWDWDGQRYCEVDGDKMDATLWRQLDQAEKFGKGRRLEGFDPKPEDVSGTFKALKGYCHTDKAMPEWFGPGRPDGDLREIIACRNGLVQMERRLLLPHTPRFWNPNVLDFDYDPKARAPRFEQFLRELWPGDIEAQEAFKDMIGVCLTDITRYQKIFMLFGPRRGGRGTTGRLLRQLIGPSNYLGTNLKTFCGEFGMQDFPGKKVIVFSDARLDGLSASQMMTITTNLLLMSGEDEMHINRKNKRFWTGILTGKGIIFSNELLRFQEETGALAGRMLVWEMKQSFWGREDPYLLEKLLAERSGILNLVLDALDRVRVNGLRQHKTSAPAVERLEALVSDIIGFVNDRCELGGEHNETVDKLFGAWQSWCRRQDISHAWGKPQFSEKLRAAYPHLNEGRPRVKVEGATKRPTLLCGIGLRQSEVASLLDEPI